MSNPEGYDENQETVEFYKIKLMEKEREISSFEAKFKKIQIKTSRDLKQLKIAEEKAKAALKEERTKVDKSTQKMHEVIEQNNILHHRLTELKVEKDKEIESVRNQYNHLKQQVRSYERILPTHTFLSQLGASIDQLPTYQDIFVNLKDKSERLEDVEAKFKAHKQESEEKIALQAKVEENLKKKKIELEKQISEAEVKYFEVSSQITTYQIEKEQIYKKLCDLEEDYNVAIEKNEELTEENKILESKMDEFIQIHHTEIAVKDEEIRKITEEELAKFEEEIERVTQSYAIKENSHLQQLAYFEEEEERLKERMLREKQSFEENYQELRKEVETMKSHFEEEKEDHFKHLRQLELLTKQFDEKEGENRQFLQKLGIYQLKIEELHNALKTHNQNLNNEKEKATESLEQLNLMRVRLEDQVEKLQQENQLLQSELEKKQNQIHLMNNEIEELKSRGSTMNRSSFPNFLPETIETILRKSSEFQENTVLEKVQSSINKLQLPKRKESTTIPKQRKESRVYYTQDQLESKLIEEKISTQYSLGKEHEKKIKEMMNEKKKEFELQMKKMQQKLSEEVKKIKKQNEGLKQEIERLNKELQNKGNEYKEEVSKVSRSFEMLKIEKEALEQNYLNQVLESKRDKEGINHFKAECKELEKSKNELSKLNQQLQVQVDLMKKFKQKVESKEQKEKSVTSSEGSSSIAIKQLMEKYNSKINQVMMEKNQVNNILEQKQEQIQKLRQEFSEKLKKYEKMEEDYDEKCRQNDMLHDLLDHERKDRTLRTVPSLASLPDQDGREEQNFKEYYNQAGQKEGQIALLEREVENVKSEFEELQESSERRIQDMENEMTEYIQEIIKMKMTVAEAEMKASQKTHLYNQLKKRMSIK